MKQNPKREMTQEEQTTLIAVGIMIFLSLALFMWFGVIEPRLNKNDGVKPVVPTVTTNSSLSLPSTVVVEAKADDRVIQMKFHPTFNVK